jgi:hypothetical protein
LLPLQRRVQLLFLPLLLLPWLSSLLLLQ